VRQTPRHTDEINDANWGTTKIIFKGGTATETTNHAKGEFTDDFAVGGPGPALASPSA
jgi:hypothetical protein